MKRIVIILCFIALIFPFHAVLAEETTEKKATEEATAAESPPEEGAPDAVKKRPPTEEESTGLDEYIYEEHPETPVVAQPAEEEEGTKTVPRRLTIDAVVVVSYKFTSNDTYSVKYHINMGGEIGADVGVIKGDAKIATDIRGFLAKSSAFECLLKVSIADIPYEITYKKTGEKEAEINVSFKEQILEDWESLCTFLDASAAKFNTRGNPERWIGVALEKAKPPLTNLIAPVDEAKTTTLKFTIPKHTVPDEGLGSAEVDGAGVVTITPRRKAPAPVPKE